MKFIVLIFVCILGVGDGVCVLSVLAWRKNLCILKRRIPTDPHWRLFNIQNKLLRKYFNKHQRMAIQFYSLCSKISISMPKCKHWINVTLWIFDPNPRTFACIVLVDSNEFSICGNWKFIIHISLVLYQIMLNFFMCTNEASKIPYEPSPASKCKIWRTSARWWIKRRVEF